jgi:hypothetical protein
MAAHHRPARHKPGTMTWDRYLELPSPDYVPSQATELHGPPNVQRAIQGACTKAEAQMRSWQSNPLMGTRRRKRP